MCTCMYLAADIRCLGMRCLICNLGHLANLQVGSVLVLAIAIAIAWPIELTLSLPPSLPPYLLPGRTEGH